MILADLGVEVILVEIPGQFSTPSYLNRNKKSMTLNLKKEKGREVFYKLAEESDVILEGFRPGVMKRLGVDYDLIKRVNPMIIYCSLTGFGQDGPYAERPGHDINYVGMGGILTDPTIPCTTIADLGAGMFAMISILTALIAREKTGKGQYIDVSMLDSVISWMGTQVGEYLATGAIPTYGIFETKDGKYITLGGIEEEFRRNLWKILMDENMVDSSIHRKEQKRILTDVFKKKTREEWVKLLNEADVPCGPVYSQKEVFSDPHVIHRGMVIKDGDNRYIGHPIKFSDTPARIRRPPPALGEQTEEILLGFGYAKPEIEEFKREGVI
jgi:crotonobetainyl-CoA:carnitine CoA-transferase CaiB-like acyl-CoA transferase